MPKVSILLMNYNYARYLHERVQSLLNQTFQDFELIIIDNGSTDESPEIIRFYQKDTRVKPLIYTDNNLFYERWNHVVDTVQGNYLLFACSDDSCHPTLLEKLVDKLDNYPSVGLAYSQSLNIDSEGKELNSWKDWTDDMNPERWSKDFINDGKDECQYLLFKNTIPNSGAGLLRREVFMKVGGFDTRLYYMADWMLWANVLMASDVAFVAEPLNYFRSHSNTNTSLTKASSELEERLLIIDFLLHNLQTSKDAREAVFNQTVGSWIKLMLSNRLPLRTNQKLYNSLSKFDSGLNYRLFRHIAKEVVEKLKLPL